MLHNINQGLEVHLDQVLQLNENAVPHVNSLKMRELRKIVGESKCFLVALDESDNVAAFLITMDDTADYQSPNYQYFRKNFRSFLYVDRIVVRDDCHGQGLGRKLYESVTEQVSENPFDYLTCEVNIRPPNPDSMAFHSRCGFAGVDEQDTEGGQKRVLLMAKNLKG